MSCSPAELISSSTLWKQVKKFIGKTYQLFLASLPLCTGLASSKSEARSNGFRAGNL
jgi:hypothetical protein